MSDTDYWKRRYEGLWADAAEREERVREILQSETGLRVELYGLGAGSTDFLSGSAESYGKEKGDPDLLVIGTRIRIEVTGPLKTQGGEKDLWVRPDKLENARDSDADHCIVHEDGDSGLLRAIHLDERFFSALDRGDFPLVHPKIRGTLEEYRAIPAGHSVVRSFEKLIQYVRASIAKADQ